MWTPHDFLVRLLNYKSVAQKVILNLVTSFRRLQYLKNDTRRRDIHLLTHTHTNGEETNILDSILTLKTINKNV